MKGLAGGGYFLSRPCTCIRLLYAPNNYTARDPIPKTSHTHRMSFVQQDEGIPPLVAPSPAGNRKAGECSTHKRCRLLTTHEIDHTAPGERGVMRHIREELNSLPRGEGYTCTALTLTQHVLLHNRLIERSTPTEALHRSPSTPGNELRVGLPVSSFCAASTMSKARI